MKVWDLHCHLVGIEGRTVHEQMANLVATADRVGIERLVVFLSSLASRDPSPDEFRRQNDDVLEAISHWHHRAFSLAYVNPNHLDESLKEIDRVVRDGPMVGIKLWVARRCGDEQIDPIIRRAAELKAIIYQHTWIKAGGNLPGESTPRDLALLAKRHPTVPLICGHTGGNWELGLREIRDLPNVSVETGGSDPTAGMIEAAVRDVGAERVLYGSDVGGRSFATQLGKVVGAAIPDATKRLILGGNLQRMLAPILAAKGIEP